MTQPPRYGPCRPGGAAYGGTKAMLDQMTRCLAMELDGTNAAANVVSPQGASRTEFVNSLVDKNVLSEELTEPLEAMAEAVLALATAPPTVRGLVVRSYELLADLGLAVHDLRGEHVLDGYDASDIGRSCAALMMRPTNLVICAAPGARRGENLRPGDGLRAQRGIASDSRTNQGSISAFDTGRANKNPWI